MFIVSFFPDTLLTNMTEIDQWSLLMALGRYSPRNDPDPEMIPNPEMIPKLTPK